ncbi:MAG: FAD/NAD(P)-binding protein [Gammaproteobacteria bacterium]|nr:FAD/NAD(P)-binding protein [Gammaproteobacteria bacterium]
MSANPYLLQRARIDWIVQECGGPRPIRTYTLDPEDSTEHFAFEPGQCVQLSVLGEGESFVAIASGPEQDEPLQVTVMRVGLVTTALHELNIGDFVGLRGPYGNGFPVDRWRGKDLLLIGGGVGQAPLRSLLHHIEANRSEFGRVQVFYGARSPEAMIYREEFAAYEAHRDFDLYLSIDWKWGPDGPLDEDACEGWARVNLSNLRSTRIEQDQVRFTGFVPQIVQAVAPSPQSTIAVTCGPPAMIRRVVEGLEGLGFGPDQIYTTLERRMKCGIGLCGRCNLGPVFVCTEGPVFSYAQLQDLPEAFA